MTSAGDVVLAYIPSPPQGVWHLGPLPIRAYALCIIIGIIVAVWWGDRRWRARGGQEGDVLDVALVAVPFGLIGGRIYHVITDWWRYFGDDGRGVKAVFEVWDGGLGIWGAVALGAVGGWVGCRWKRIKLPAFGDAIAPAILAAQAIGRLGNYFNQELYGEPTTVPWGLELFNRVDPDTGRSGISVIDGVAQGDAVAVVHPTFLYELLWNLLIVALLVIIDRRFQIGHGRLFAMYVAGYCVGRFGIELMRSDEATHVLGLRVNVLVSALVFLGAALYVVMAPKGREQGLSMFWPDRAEQLAAEGEVGYVPPSLPDDEDFADEDFEDADGADEDWADPEASDAEESDAEGSDAEESDAEESDAEESDAEDGETDGAVGLIEDDADVDAAEADESETDSDESAADAAEADEPETDVADADDSDGDVADVDEPETDAPEPHAPEPESAAADDADVDAAESGADEPADTETDTDAESAEPDNEAEAAEDDRADHSDDSGEASTRTIVDREDHLDEPDVPTAEGVRGPTPSIVAYEGSEGYTVSSSGGDYDAIEIVEENPGWSVGAIEIRSSGEADEPASDGDDTSSDEPSEKD